jgi:hypothetical protein
LRCSNLSRYVKMAVSMLARFMRNFVPRDEAE